MTNLPLIPLRLDGRGSRIYYPGETLAGSYYLGNLGNEPIDAVEVSVLWHTEGKGNEDFGIHEFWRRSVSDGDWIDNSTPGRFHTKLPNSPLSYDGELVKIFWLIRIRVFLSDGREIVDEHSFRLGNIANVRALRLVSEADSAHAGENGPEVPGLPVPARHLKTSAVSPHSPDSPAPSSPSEAAGSPSALKADSCSGSHLGHLDNASNSEGSPRFETDSAETDGDWEKVAQPPNTVRQFMPSRPGTQSDSQETTPEERASTITVGAVPPVCAAPNASCSGAPGEEAAAFSVQTKEGGSL